MNEGKWYPSEEEAEKCMQGKPCEYGICDECQLSGGTKEAEED